MARILVVEEHEHNRRAIARLLEQHGHDVTTATNGAETILTALESQPDLILMAHSLPIMSGTVATSRLRTQRRLAATPIILIGPDDADERQLALYAGCDDYVTKPVIPAKLLVAVNHQLRAVRSKERDESFDRPAASARI